MTTQTKDTEWTDEDKAWAIGGGLVVAGGLIYWYMQSNKASAPETVAGTDTATYVDSAETLAIGTGTSEQSSSTATPVATKRQADQVRWQVGQIMMANSKAGTKAYEAKKMANGQYTSSGTLAKTFAMGDKIGKIIWVGAFTDGTYRYVIEADGTFSNDYYWISDYRVITPTDNSKPIAAKTVTSSLNAKLLLKKGSKGNEVRELQRLLGVKIDGDFGVNTLAALQAQKGVSQITLAAFASTNPLNFNLMLKKGSKGLEVKELQKRLGFTGYNVDGIFGVNTESALYAMKRVKQTTLNQFSFII